MVPMDQLGPQPRGVNPKDYAHVIEVAPGGKFTTVAGALASVADASASKRYATRVRSRSHRR